MTDPIAAARELLADIDLHPEHIVSRDGLEVGDIAEWRYSTRGKNFHRVGVVLAVIPAGMRVPGKAGSPERRKALINLGIDVSAVSDCWCSMTAAMPYESYIIASRNKPTHKPRIYRPHPHTLRKVDP